MSLPPPADTLPESLGSAANKVFRTAEVVAVIIRGFRQPELYNLVALTRELSRACQEVLYLRPSIEGLDVDDDRLDRLVWALARRVSGYATGLAISAEVGAFPSEKNLKALFRHCHRLQELELGGESRDLTSTSGLV